MKRLLSLVLCALLLVSLVVPVYAETDPTETTAATDASTEAETEAASEESTETATEDATEAETEEATEESTEEATEPAATQSAEVTEKTASMNDVAVNVSGAIPEEVSLSVEEADVEHSDFGVENSEDIVAAMDINLMDEQGEEWQPEESVTVTIDALSLGLAEGDEVEIMHEHEGVVTSLGIYAVMDGKLTFPTNGFSIYVVVGNNNNITNSGDDNYVQYKIYMSVGETYQVKSTTTGNNYSWSISSGDSDAFTLSDENKEIARITANRTGSIILRCKVGNRTTETITVTSVPAVGSDYGNDVIFARVNKNYTSGDDEYEKSYGPTVMKIRFEDSDGNLLSIGQEYYTFDSVCNIDASTFSASAPDGYVYAGAFFYWTSHDGYDGAKVYVTSVERKSSEAYGSYLWYSGTHDSSGSGSWAYQASGVLHIVYAKTEDANAVVFEDHDGYDLANYALPHNDGGSSFPTGYVSNIDNIAQSLINYHHASSAPGYEFTDYWTVTGGGDGIDGTYTTNELKSKITSWKIYSNITITAQCAEPSVTIKYVPSPNTGGSVSIPSETVKVSSEDTKGSTATANADYTFVGWFDNAEGSGTALSTEATFNPQKVDGKNAEATYYAVFQEIKVTINYKVIGIDGKIDTNGTYGTVSPTSEMLSVLSGVAQGSTATASSNQYKFVGWYSDEECTKKVGSDAKYTPEKVNGKNVTATYYAKFESNVGSLTINKKVEGVDTDKIPAGLEFTFTVYDAQNTKIDSVTLNSINNWTATVPNLAVGTYTVVETKVDIPHYKLTKVTANGTDVTNGTERTTASAAVSVTGGATREVKFVNTYALDIADLTIKKVGGSGELFEFSVVCEERGINMTVCVPGGGSITLKDLPLGTYTVTEDTGWSYRYTCTSASGSVIIEANKNNSLTFTNTLTNDKWLGGESFARNIFTGSTGTTG